MISGAAVINFLNTHNVTSNDLVRVSDNSIEILTINWDGNQILYSAIHYSGLDFSLDDLSMPITTNFSRSTILERDAKKIFDYVSAYVKK